MSPSFLAMYIFIIGTGNIQENIKITLTEERREIFLVELILCHVQMLCYKGRCYFKCGLLESCECALHSTLIINFCALLINYKKCDEICWARTMVLWFLPAIA